MVISTTYCKNCNKKFERLFGKRQYCSYSCMTKYRDSLKKETDIKIFWVEGDKRIESISLNT